MSKPTEQELRKLDAFCGEHVMEFERVTESIPPNLGDIDWWLIGNTATMFNPSTDRSGAMQVLKRCSNKCTVEIQNIHGKGYMVWSGTRQHGEFHETLEIGISEFAKNLFSK